MQGLSCYGKKLEIYSPGYKVPMKGIKHRNYKSRVAFNTDDAVAGKKLNWMGAKSVEMGEPIKQVLDLSERES